MWNTQQRKEYDTVLKHHWPRQKSALSHCQDPDLKNNRTHLQGGIAQTIHGRHTGRTTNYFEDKMGRWVSQTLSLKNNKTLTIITAYRPCSMKIDITTETVVAQQYKAMKRNGTNRHPRVQFNHDLRLFIKQQQSMGNEILIGIDANLAQPNDKAFEELKKTCDLVDIISNRHGKPTATHKNGNRLDLILGTQWVVDNIIATGSLHEMDGADSDHAALFIDLTTNIFVKNNDPVAQKSRGFTSKHKHKFLKFGQRVDSKLCNNNSLNALLHELEITSGNAKKAICEKIDYIITQVMITEENKLSCQANIIAWSPKYETARSDYLKARNIHKKFKKKHSFPLNYDNFIIYAFLNNQLKKTKSELRKIKKKAIHNRIEFLLEKIKLAADEKDQKMLKSLRNIYRSELRRYAFLKLTPMVKGITPTSLDKVIVTQQDGTPTELTTKQDMNTALIQRNANHFNQAGDTPFATPPLTNIIDPIEPNNTIATKLLAGDISDFKEQQTIITDLLQQIERLPTITNASHEMSDEEFKAGMIGISEGKSSSQSGRHYSLYKALVAFPFTTQTMVKIISTCVTNNIIISRWKKVLQVMLCKIPGNFNIEKMRVINLIEADINMFFRLIWGKKLVRNIIQNDLFLTEQMGNRPGYQCSSAVLSKVLSFDTIRLLRLPATIFNNDATACYDRIIPFLSLLCCQHFGLSSTAAEFMLNFLKNAEYHIRTCYGTSDEFYSHCMQAIFGVLQGSGSASSIWLVMSLILIKTYKHKFDSTSIPNPTNDFALKKVIDAFVDDADLWDILTEDTSTEELLERLEVRAQYWEKLLHSAGGKLNFIKCYWYIIQWKWDEYGVPSMMNNTELPAELTLTNGNDTTYHVMKRKSPSEALKTLGVLTSPSGSNAAQFKKVQTYLTELMIEIKSKILTQLEASLLIPVYLHSKLRYILAATTFTQDECDELDKIFRATILSKTGINKATNLSIIHSSHHFGGLQIPTCWDLQGSQHLHLLLGHIQLGDNIGQQLMLTMDYLYLHLGLQDPIMTYDFKQVCKVIEPSWIANTWCYLSSVKATVHSKTLFIPPQRENDTTIMTPAIHYLSSTKFHRVNAVRLYLKLFYISDIATSSGRKISQEYLFKNRQRYRTANLHWPTQACPGKKSWQEWKAYIKKYFTTGKQTLAKQLGKWNENIIRTQTWNTQIDPNNRIIYIKSNTNYQKYILKARSRFRIKKAGQTTELPPTVLPVTIIGLPLLPRIEEYTTNLSMPMTTMPRAVSFSQYVSRLPNNERIIIGMIQNNQHWEMLNILDMLTMKSYAIGSDGSVRGNSASYGTCIQSTTINEVFIQSFAKLQTNSSFTAESFGYLAALYLLRALLLFYNIPIEDHTVETFLDNKGLLKRLQYEYETSIKHCQRKGAAVIREIKAVEKSLNMKFNRQHVKSHVYDKEDDYNKIPLPNRINKRSDIIAEKAYQQQFKCHANNTLLPTTTIHIKHNNKIYTDDAKRTFQYATKDTELQQYIMEKNNWTLQQFQYINWEYLRTTFYRSTTRQRKAFMKITHKKWATNEMKSKWSNRNDNRCMRCRRLHEDWEHIFRCTSAHSKDFITTKLEEIQIFLESSNTSNIFQSIFMNGLTSWILNEPIIFQHDPNEFNDAIFGILYEAFLQQSSIGWDQLLCGRIVNSWFIAHDQYVSQRNLDQTYTSKAFGPRLVRHLLQFSLQIWCHRNEFYFGKDANESTAKQTLKADEAINEAYKQPALVPLQDHTTIFSKSLQEMLSLKLSAKTNWIKVYNISIQVPPTSATIIPEPPDQEHSPQSSNPSTHSLHKFFHRFLPIYNSTTE